MKSRSSYTGILYAIILGATFTIIALWTKPHLDGVPWYLFSSLHRLVYGLAALFLFCRLYTKKPGEIFHLQNIKTALLAGSGFILYLLYYIITLFLGIDHIEELTFPLVFSHLFLQQITTGFFEEMTYRGLVLEGYFLQENKTLKAELIYAFASYLLFGLAHISGGLYNFVFTGILGFSFTVIYLRSHNILIPMGLHFLYDVFANMNDYIRYNDSTIFQSFNTAFPVIVAVMFLLSFCILIKYREL